MHKISVVPKYFNNLVSNHFIQQGMVIPFRGAGHQWLV